jgi:hypothetical protein
VGVSGGRGPAAGRAGAAGARGLGGHAGPGAGARCAAAISGLLAAVFGVLLLSALPDLRAENLRPWGSARGGAAAFAALLFPAAALCARPEGDSRLSGDASAALALMAAAASLAAAGCLSPALAAAEPLPFYALVKSLTVFGVLERFEPLYSAAVLASGFCLVSLLLDAGAALLRRAGSFDRASALPLLLYLPLFALSARQPGFRRKSGRLAPPYFGGFSRC